MDRQQVAMDQRWTPRWRARTAARSAGRSAPCPPPHCSRPRRTADPLCEAGLRTAGGGPVRTAGGASALRSACGPHAAFLPSAVLMIRTAGDPHS